MGLRVMPYVGMRMTRLCRDLWDLSVLSVVIPARVLHLRRVHMSCSLPFGCISIALSSYHVVVLMV